MDEQRPAFGSEQALEARVGAVRNILQSPELHSFTDAETTLAQYWCDELGNNIQPSIDRNREKWGGRTVMVVQFADGALHYQPDARFTDAYLKAFGAEARFAANSGIGEMVIPADSRTISGIARNPELPRLPYWGNSKISSIPTEHSWLLVDENDKPSMLILNTKIEGVRLIFDGSAVSAPDNGFRQLRPMMLIKVAEQSFKPQLTMEAIAKAPKSWLDVHGRDPRAQEANNYHGQKLLDGAIIGNTEDLETEVAAVAASWRPEAKDPKDIVVTPTRLREQPAIPTDEERISVIREALNVSVKHLRLSEKRLVEGVVGATAASLSIIADTLHMTPEEIAGDGEAMADLVEYIEEVARATKGVYGHSSLLGEASPDDPNMELVTLIKGTWEFPERGMSPFMYSRVSWNKRNRYAGSN